MAGEVQLDALPCIDQGYEDPGVRKSAMRPVEEETRRYRPTKNYLEFLPTPRTTFETPILKAEFDRLAARQPMEMLSMKRYELPQPGAAQRNDLGAWQVAVDNSMAQLEHQAGRRKPLIPRLLTKYLLLITFIWQTLSVGFLEVIDGISDKENNSTSHSLNLTSNVVVTVFQAVHLLLVFFVSWKLARQVMHRTASGSLLSQTYLSTVLLFAGLYTLMFRFNASSWRNVETHDRPLIPVLLFVRMLYCSVSTGTLCGTSEIEPVRWYTDMIVALQMLMSFVYFASILSLAVIPRKRSRFDPPPGPIRSFTRKIRQCVFQEND